MSDDGNNAGEHVAQWLKEAGRRAPKHAPLPEPDAAAEFNSPASLHKYVEELAGRQLKTHADVLSYLREVAGNQPEAHATRERHRMVRELALLGLLAMSYLHFYYWDVQLQIAALNSVRINMPVPVSLDKKA